MGFQECQRERELRARTSGGPWRARTDDGGSRRSRSCPTTTRSPSRSRRLCPWRRCCPTRLLKPWTCWGSSSSTPRASASRPPRYGDPLSLMLLARALQVQGGGPSVPGWNQSPGGSQAGQGPQAHLAEEGIWITADWRPHPFNRYSAPAHAWYHPGPWAWGVGTDFGECRFKQGRNGEQSLAGGTQKGGSCGREGWASGRGLLASSARASVLGVPVSPASRLLSALAP